MKRFCLIVILGILVAIASVSFGQCAGGRCCVGGNCSGGNCAPAQGRGYWYPTFGGWYYYETPIVAETVTPEELKPEEEQQLEEAVEEAKVAEATGEEEIDVVVLPTFREIALARINAFRASAGLPALELDEGLCSACDAHSRFMGAYGFQHAYGGGMECIAMGVNSPEGAVAMWINSPSHAGILRARGAKLGIGRWGYFWTLRVR